MSFSRRYLFAALGLAILGAAAVLYVIPARHVHESSGPPPALARLGATLPPRNIPAIAFTDGAGKHVTLEGFKGKFVLVNLWASWCAPCVKELPALARLHEAVPHDQLDVVAINVGRATEEESQAFLKAHGAGSLDVYMDSDHALLRAFNTFVLPLSVLIGPDGRQTGQAIGPASWDAPEAISYLRMLTTLPRKAPASPNPTHM
ncbi:MAG TPA: TlpA disulfide reductase family protein [Rhizomicrobium sp.]|jgi:thiol-disulfide isomerase/thioredoxin